MLSGIKILVVEDNLVNQKITGYLLKKLNADVYCAMNGKEAIDLLMQHNYDVILMDVQMPGMDGFATTQHIRNELKNDIPVIALTADIFINETNEFGNSGMNASISKPFDLERIGELILSLVKVKDFSSNQTI